MQAESIYWNYAYENRTVFDPTFILHFYQSAAG